jgi:sphingolipid delta-4 desaturase
VLSFDAVLVHFLGWNALVYLLISSFFAGSLHPCAAHFIAEHYLMNEVQDGTPQALAQETTSYYGWLNVLCYNVRRVAPLPRIWLNLADPSGRIPQRAP